METTELTNFLELCLLCTSPPNPVQPHIHITSELGTEHKLWEKIHKHLTIKVVEGLPQMICHDCIYKLELCHELVKCSEESHVKLLEMKGQWELKVKTEPIDYDGEPSASPIQIVYSPVDESDIKIEETCLLETETNSDYCSVNPSNSKDCTDSSAPLKIKMEHEENNDTMETDLSETSQISEPDSDDNDDDARNCTKSPELLLVCKTENFEEGGSNSSTVENLEVEVDPNNVFDENNVNNSFEVDPIMETSSHMILGSQLAFFYADRDGKCIYPIVHHVLINIDEETGHNKYQMLEKISRIGKQCKTRIKFLQENYKTQRSWTTTPLFHCHRCKYSFFMREEMELHFESLHPYRVRPCARCNKNIYGSVSCPEQVSSCHLHDLSVSSKYKSVKYDPEFLVIPLGQLEKHNESEALRLMLRLNSIVGNQLVKDDMRPKIWVALKNFIMCNEIRPRNSLRITEYSRVQCHFCMKLMSKRAMRSHVKLHLNSQFNNGFTPLNENSKVQTFSSTRNHFLNNIRQQVSHSLNHPNQPVSHSLSHHPSPQDSHSLNQPSQQVSSKLPPFVVNQAVMAVCCHCRQAFRSISLALHIEVAHFGGKVLMCRICDEQYKVTGLVQPHMMTMSCQRYKCPFGACKRGYMYKTLLKAHIKICHPQRRVRKPPVKCELCGRTFKGKGFIARHIKLVHFKGVT
ncbi:hypothetical protein B566_EDAN013446 [Ephemera danica]|nr:hypothetical protein B566_EDAN013446 [Ephemera danica]